MRALLGVSDKTGIIEFAQGLHGLGVELIATGKTAATIRDAGIPVKDVADITGFPEMLDGRVKTLHPAVHAGILARRDNADHMEQMRQHGFGSIDIVAVNLYPFAETVAQGADDATVIENIDIGGPTLIRAAAKNADSVAVVTNPTQYPALLDELRAGGISQPTRNKLAAKAFAHVAAYDTEVAHWLNSRLEPNGARGEFTTGGHLLSGLRYGENPHQTGALYAIPGVRGGVAGAKQLQGPALSFTNWLDTDSALSLVTEFNEPAACIIKHTNPCGFAVGDTLLDAYRRAYECDPRSAFGGIVGLNRTLDLATAREISKTFLEVVICTGIDQDAAAHLAAKERLRVLVVDRPDCSAAPDVRSISGGLLVQTQDRIAADRQTMQVVSKRQPSESEWNDLLLAWKICRHVKSNAVVIVKDGMAVGVGAGQMSRVEASEMAVRRGGEKVRGGVAASDAFFPMPDGLETLGNAGVTAVVHPGGSKKDDEVTTAADTLNMSVVLTGERHFRH